VMVDCIPTPTLPFPCADVEFSYLLTTCWVVVCRYVVSCIYEMGLGGYLFNYLLLPRQICFKLIQCLWLFVKMWKNEGEGKGGREGRRDRRVGGSLCRTGYVGLGVMR